MPRGTPTSSEKITKILKAYRRGVPVEHLARVHKVSARSVQKYVADAKKPRPSSAAAKKPKPKKKATPKKAKKRVQPKAKKKTVKKAAKKKTAKKQSKGERILKEIKGTKKAGPGRPPGPVLKIADTELLRQRKEGATIEQLSKTHGVSGWTIRHHLKKAADAPTPRRGKSPINNVVAVMGNSVMDADEVMVLLKKRHQTPKSQDPRKYVVRMLSIQKDVFEPVKKAQGGGRGKYKVRAAASSEEVPLLQIQAVTSKTRKWKAMKKIWDLCTRQGLSAPPEVQEFFGNEKPGGDGALVSLQQHLKVSGGVVYLSIKSLPRGTKKLRIVLPQGD